MGQQAIPSTPLYTEVEAAEYLRKSPGSLRNDRHKGIGCDYIKIGEKVFYTLEQLDAYIKAGVRKCG